MSAGTFVRRGLKGMNSLPWSLRALLQLSPNEALFATRGFSSSNESIKLSLERVGKVFIGGLNASLAARDVGTIRQHVEETLAADRGFAAEGATMGAALADALPFGPPLLVATIAAFKQEFEYLTHVGAGWALARAPWRRRQILAPLDPIHWWLAIDGLGFHDTYFYHRCVVDGWRRKQSGYGIFAYDQGVGRALWFVSGGSVAAATRLITRFANERQSDLWAGLGLAMTYAGPVTADDAADVLRRAGRNTPWLAQGVAFGCAARAGAHHIPAHTGLMATLVWGKAAGELAELVGEWRRHLPSKETDPPRYQTWRQSVARDFSRKVSHDQSA